MSNEKPTLAIIKARKALYLAKLLGSLPRPPQSLVRLASDRRALK